MSQDFANKKFTVKSRSTGGVSYKIPDLRINREFTAGEVKRDIISGAELEHLTYIPGGLKLLEKYLVIPKEAAEGLGLKVEPEYFYTEKDVVELLKNGSYEQFLDCLDFAPGGVLDLVKKNAVDMKLNDMRKREAIKSVLGFDVTRAIDNTEYSKGKDDGVEEQKSRRVAEAGDETPKRRYNVTSRG